MTYVVRERGVLAVGQGFHVKRGKGNRGKDTKGNRARGVSRRDKEGQTDRVVLEAQDDPLEECGKRSFELEGPEMEGGRRRMGSELFTSRGGRREKKGDRMFDKEP